MKRCLSVLAATLAMSLPFADIAQADHDRARGDGVLRLRIGPIEFRSQPSARSDRRRGVVVMRAFPYDTDDDVRIPFPRGDARWLERQEARQRDLDRQLGSGLRQLRRSGAVAVSQRPLPAPRMHTATPTRATGIIEEAEVLGPPPPVPAILPDPKPLTEVGTASAADVDQHGAAAFAILSTPDALGLPELPDGGSYYVLNGRVVTLDAEAQKALTVAALQSALR